MGGRLVEQQDGWRRQQYPGKAEPLALAGAQGPPAGTKDRAKSRG